MPIQVLSRSSDELTRKRGDADRFARPGRRPATLPEQAGSSRQLDRRVSQSWLSSIKSNGRPGKSSIPRRPALGLSVAQPNPSVANSLRLVHCVKASTRSFTAGSPSRAASEARLNRNSNIAVAVKAAAVRFSTSMNDCRGFIFFVSFAGTIAAPRDKQMTTSQKNSDVSVAIM
jgi:hypothetical protein